MSTVLFLLKNALLLKNSLSWYAGFLLHKLSINYRSAFYFVCALSICINFAVVTFVPRIYIELV